MVINRTRAALAPAVLVLALLAALLGALGPATGARAASCPALTESPVPLGPSGVTSESSPLISWTPVAGIDEYIVVVLYASDDAQYVFPGQPIAVQGTSYRPPPLPNATPMRWKVKTECDERYGPYSPSVYFSVAAPAPPSCPLTAPVPFTVSGTITDRQPTFSWSAVPGADSYTLYVLDEAKNQVVRAVDIRGTTYRPDPLPVGVRLRWKVKGESAACGAGPYSPPDRWFMVVPGRAVSIPGFSPDVAAAAVDALARTQGVSSAAAARQLARQESTAALGERVAASLGARAGGFWLQPADGALVVDVTDRGAMAAVRAAGAKARLVTRSAQNLASIQRGLRPLLVPGTSAGVDVVRNQVVLTVTAAAGRPTALLAAAAKYGAAVRVEQTAGSFGVAIVGGHPIDGSVGCSLGFNTTGGTAVTAGHCTAASAQWWNGNNGRFFGTSIASNFPGDDFGVIRNDGNLSQPPEVINYSTGASQRITGAANNFTGQWVCKSGRTTGTTCASIGQINVTVNYPQGQVSELVQADLCVRPGDSGGAVFDGGTAKGIISGVKNGSCTSFYQPVVEALQRSGVWVL